MASDGDKPLPDTDDPFVLLGVAPDSDDKAIKQAYAKLIRRFRPDRAPSEFQRIHAAFELVREAREQGTSRFELRHALTNDSDEPPSAVEGETDRSVVLRHPRPSWSRLREESDLRTALGAWEMAWDDALLHDHDHARAFHLLDDEQLRLDAANHVRVADSVLRRIGALAWRRLGGIEALFDGYRRAIPNGLYVDHLLDSIQLEIEAARSVHDIDGPIRWLTPLLVATRIGTREERRDLARAFLAMLHANVEGVLVELHHLQRQVDLGPLFELIYDYLPSRHFRLDALPPPAFESLSRRLQRIGHQPYKWAIRAGVAAASALAGYVIGVLPVAAVLGVGGVYLLATEERRYRRQVRPRIARAIARCAVTPEVLARWIQINGRRSGRLWMFELMIRSDAVLYTFAMLASFASYVGELDDTDD